ncbi:hypothetical protein BJ165DRAFT_1535620 [Panaeolus papilionaceus]|nr:hypothetical protein BJ165DRAFT_1535620 [Panaeolus papilionaceus]
MGYQPFEPKLPIQSYPSPPPNPSPLHATTPAQVQDIFYGPHNFTPQSPYVSSPHTHTNRTPSPLQHAQSVVSRDDSDEATFQGAEMAVDEVSKMRNLPPAHSINPIWDTVNHVSKFFGYTPVLDKNVTPIVSLDWMSCMKVLGCVETDAPAENEKLAIRHFVAQLLKGPNQVHVDFDDLNPQNRIYLAGLYSIHNKVIRVHSNLYVFRKPHSHCIDWCLGVTTAAAALLVVWLIVESPNHTLLTLLALLLQMSILFRTLILLPDCSLRQPSATTTEAPDYHFPFGHQFTLSDYDDYLTQIHQLLSCPAGQAAITKGGLVAEIVRRFIGFDRVAEGPSDDVHDHHCGDIFESEQEGFKYMDDRLTDKDVAILIGSYHIETRQANQLSIASWLPPPSAFYEQTKTNYWTYWSPVDSDILDLIFRDIENGVGRPKSKRDWRKWVWGRQGPAAAPTPIFYDHLTEQSEDFMRSVFNIAL